VEKEEQTIAGPAAWEFGASLEVLCVTKFGNVIASGIWNGTLEISSGGKEHGSNLGRDSRHNG
jgi:hypothetical protein